MAFVKKFNDFKLFQPTEDEASAAEKNLPARLALNKKFLENNPPSATLKMTITGSFISAHAPDYIGVPTIHWSMDDWQKEFRIMKENGIDTAIFQASAWKELEECYFPSEVLKDFEIFDTVTPLVEAAQAEKMTIYLGGLGSVAGWDLQNEEKTGQEIELHKSVLRELSNIYGDRISGFYFPCETAFRGERRFDHEAQYSKILGEFCRVARELLPGKEIVMSPASKYFEGKDKDFLDCWKKIFSKGAPDILAPQDSIGCGCITLDHQLEALEIWHRIAEDCGIEHWSNVECFECCPPYIDETSRRAADPERIILQMNNASRFVEKLITWELLYYGDPDLHPPGQKFVNEIFLKNAKSEGK